jgi:cytochrome c-type biogenesis protein CcmH
VSPEAVPPAAVAAIARDLNCPLCQGYNLQDCPLQVCAQMRDLIRAQLAAGATQDQIVDGFVAQYGPQVLMVPPTEGGFALAWVLPWLVLFGGGAVVVLLLRRSTAGSPAAMPQATGGVLTQASRGAATMAASAGAIEGPPPDPAADALLRARFEALASAEDVADGGPR